MLSSSLALLSPIARKHITSKQEHSAHLEVYDCQATDFSLPATILIDLVPDSSFMNDFLYNRPYAINPTTLVLIFSDKRIPEKILSSETNTPFLQEGKLKIWHISEWNEQLHEESKNFRSPLLFCRTISGKKGCKILHEVEKSIKSLRRTFLKASHSSRKTMKSYYSSDEFSYRLEEISRGKTPRIYVDRSCLLVATKRFSDGVAKAFRELGCEVFIHDACAEGRIDYVMATNREIHQFKPDLMIKTPNLFQDPPSLSINPGPPTLYPFQDIPANLYHLNHIKKTGLGKYDSVITIFKDFVDKYLALGLRKEQVLFDLLPSDELVINLEAFPKEKKYDIGFLKTITPHPLFKETGFPQPNEEIDLNIAQEIMDISLEGNIPLSYQECLGIVPPNWKEKASGYYHQHFCLYYIRALHKEGFDLSLTGANWELWEEFQPYARGSAEELVDLQKSFIENKINISMNAWTYFHPRVLQGGRCGAFFLLYKGPERNSVLENPRTWIPGKHFDTFSSKEELIEKCRFYLGRADLREEMGSNLKKLVEEDYSYKKLCSKLLNNFRKLICLQNTP